MYPILEYKPFDTCSLTIFVQLLQKECQGKRIIIIEFSPAGKKAYIVKKYEHELFVLKKMNDCCCFYCIFTCTLSFISVRPLLNFRVLFAYSNPQYVLFTLCKNLTKLYIISHRRSFVSIMPWVRKAPCKQSCERRIC